MDINQALQKRISDLCQEKGIPSAVLINENSTIEDIETICSQFEISLADFFVNDLFRNI